MASSLIERLNALATLTPDEIAAKIKQYGFIKASDLTEDQYNAMRDLRIHFWNSERRMWEGYRTPRNPKRIRVSWPYYPRWRSGFVDRPNHWWFIPVDEYKEGMICP